MTAKQLKGRFIRKVMMHMLFQIGGAVVIIGALFKILHLEIGPLTGGVVLGLGLGTEAIIFLIGGLMLDDVREEQAEYEAYLTKGGATSGGGSKDEGLSEKIDSLLKEKLAEVLISEITPVGKEIQKLLKDKSYLKKILKKGTEKANIIAEENLKNIREKVGLI